MNDPLGIEIEAVKPVKKKRKKSTYGKTRCKTHKPQLTEIERLTIRAELETGKSANKTAKLYNVAPNTVKAIKEDKNLDLQAEKIALIKEKLADKLLLVADIAASRVVELIPQAKDVQRVATTFGIMFDKHRLMTNQSTENKSINVYLDLVNGVQVDDKFDK